MAIFCFAQDHVTSPPLPFQKLLGDSGTSCLCLSGDSQTPESFQVCMLLSAAVKAGFSLSITAQFCGVAGKYHMLSHCGSVDMTLLSCHAMILL